MKKVAILFLAMFPTIAILTSHTDKQPLMHICIEVDKTTAAINEKVTVKECGDEPPPFVKLSIDWGDGTKPTSGKTGTHTYAKVGVYTIKLLGNGSPVSEKIGSKDEVEKKITIKK